jgi:hypothetical protein
MGGHGGDVLDLASFAFFDTYFAPNDLRGLARFNQVVSGYWLGKEVAVIVRAIRIFRLICALYRVWESRNFGLINCSTASRINLESGATGY